jgi:HAD superfamily hydrolase (TIGR01509 family)
LRREVILWDLDGVLVRTEDLYFRATRDALLCLDVELDRATYHQQFLRELIDPLRVALRQRDLDSLFRDLHGRRLRRYLDLLAQEDIAVDGATETLQALANTYAMGVVTGSKREQVEVVRARADFFHLFEFVVVREDVPATKPDPAPYLEGIRRSGLGAAACLAIEDSERGLRSARAAGLDCWVIPNGLTRGADFGGAGRLIHDIRDLARLL